jgi:hypothetical protein
MKTKTILHNGINVVNLDSIRSAKYEDNIDRYGDHSNTCYACGKPTGSQTFVHETTCGLLVPANIGENELGQYGLESQGCFPIGSECAKKLDAAFIVKYAE